MKPFFAQVPEVPWSATGSWMVGLIGVLGVVYLGLGVWSQIKKLFGQTPPMHEALEQRDKALRKMIFASEAGLKERIQTERVRIDQLEQRYLEMQIDRERKWSVLQKSISELAEMVAFIRGTLKDK